MANSDYTPIVSQTLNFNGTANENQTFTITPTTDAIIETDETVNVFMNNYIGQTGVTFTDTAVITILNDDTASISINDPASVPEGNSGTSTINFAVSIDQADPNNDITVQYTISGVMKMAQEAPLLLMQEPLPCPKLSPLLLMEIPMWRQMNLLLLP